MKIKVHDELGEFAEDKDWAAKQRLDIIIPSAVKKKKKVTIDFTGVHLATQSFVHALISDVVREHPDEFFGRVSFTGCAKPVRSIIEVVVEYSQIDVET